jgi:hypothetical protein
MDDLGHMSACHRVWIVLRTLQETGASSDLKGFNGSSKVAFLLQTKHDTSMSKVPSVTGEICKCQTISNLSVMTIWSVLWKQNPVF